MVTIMEHFRTGKQVKNALESELQEILMAMQHVCSKGFRKIMIEQDCKKKNDRYTEQSVTSLVHFDALIGREILCGGNKSFIKKDGSKIKFIIILVRFILVISWFKIRNSKFKIWNLLVPAIFTYGLVQVVII